MPREHDTDTLPPTTTSSAAPPTQSGQPHAAAPHAGSSAAPATPVAATAATDNRTTFLDLSLTQLTGGALAASSAAALGARLGVGGTLLGAAIGSLVSAVAAAAYTHSLRRTRDFVLRRGHPVQAGDGSTTRIHGSPPGAPRAAAPHADPNERAGAHPVPRGLADQGGADPGPRRGADSISRVRTDRAVESATQIASSARLVQPSRLDLRRVALGAAALFGLVIALVTGIELATGHALDGKEGTTVGQVTRVGGQARSPRNVPADQDGTRPSDTSTSAPGSSSSSPAESPSDSPTSPETTTEPTTSAPTTTEPTAPEPPTTTEPPAGAPTEPGPTPTTDPLGAGRTSGTPAPGS